MAFMETPRFPDDIAQGSVGGPGYSTDVTVMFSGHEARNINWSRARGRWEASSAVRTAADFDAVRDMFRMARGRAHGFRFKDWGDYDVTTDEGVLTLVAGSLYQLVKRYGSGDQAESRLITKPVAASVTVYPTRAEVTAAITVTLDTTTGGVTVSGHVEGDVYTWDGEFDVPVRFDTDELRAQLVGPERVEGSPLMVWESVPLIEIRVAEASA